MEQSHWQEWLFVGAYVTFLVTIAWIVIAPRQ